VTCDVLSGVGINLTVHHFSNHSLILLFFAGLELEAVVSTYVNSGFKCFTQTGWGDCLQILMSSKILMKIDKKLLPNKMSLDESLLTLKI
jgi:hypothetical protein